MEIKAILIDPTAHEITEHMIERSNLHDIYSLIDATTFTIAAIGEEGDGIFVDDEGLFKELDYFMHDDYPSQPLAGKGLIIGCNMEDGSSRNCVTTLEETKQKVRWVERIS